MSIKPILFNTDMVRALLDGRKTVTRRVVKAGNHTVLRGGTFHGADGGPKYGAELDNHGVAVSPYQPSDILYVRETWSQTEDGGFLYRAWPGKGQEPEKQDEAMRGLGLKWRPAIHMPREAARIFLRVTDVRVERLRDIDADGCIKEGIPWQEVIPYVGALPDNPAVDMDAVVGNAQRMEEQKLVEESFSRLWDSTIKPADREKYGWAANPWVWVIKFERCEKPRFEGDIERKVN